MKRMFNPRSGLGYRMMVLLFNLKDLFGTPDRKLDDFALFPGAVVVDYGCGPGRYLRKASDLVGPEGRVFPVDVSPIAVEMVRTKIRKYDMKNVLPVPAGNETTGIGDHCADIVYALDMFHQIGDPKPFLAEIHRILKKEGKFFLEDGHQARNTTLAKVADSGLWRVERETRRHLLLVPV